MPESPEFNRIPEPAPQPSESRWRQLGSRVLDFVNPRRVRRREALQHASERDEFLAHLGEAIVVTNVVGANAFHFVSQTDDTLHEPAKLTTRGQATRLGGALTDMYLELGSGTHPVAAAASVLGLNESRTAETAEHLTAVMPSPVFTYETALEKITLGNIALASRKATAPERAEYRERAAAAKAEAIAAWKERHNREKTDLTECDHVLAVTSRRRFYLPLDTIDAILAARVLSALGQHQVGERLEGLAIAQAVWTSMPTMERELFTNEESQVVGKESAIDAQVLDILYKLTGRLGMTHEVKNAIFRVQTVPAVSFEADPIKDADTASLAPVFPPGTPRQIIEEFRSNKAILPEHAEMARHALSHILKLPADTRMEDKPALALLDFIMSREGKRALQAELEASGSRRKVKSVVRSLSHVVRTSLGPAYSGARRARTIGGNRIGKRVRQVGGALPGATTKWYIGIKGAEEEGRR